MSRNVEVSNKTRTGGGLRHSIRYLIGEKSFNLNQVLVWVPCPRCVGMLECKRTINQQFGYAHASDGMARMAN